MSYLDTFNRKGIRISIRSSGNLRFEPGWLVTDDLLDLARSHRDEIVADVRGCGSAMPDADGEIVPDYHFLWVATDLDSFEEHDPRFGYELNCEPVYRMLDTPYYAWLRHRMENARKSHDAGRLDDAAFEVLRTRFNMIHTWAVQHIGEDALRRAMRTTNVKTYVPPSEQTFAAYRKTWDDAWEQHLRNRRPSRSAISMRATSAPDVPGQWDYMCARCRREFKLRGTGETIAYRCNCGYSAKVRVTDIPKLLAYESFRSAQLQLEGA